jgi:streptogramin lyase
MVSRQGITRWKMRSEVTTVVAPKRTLSAAVVMVVALVGLLAAGRWLQPRIEQQTPAALSTRPQPTTPAATETTTASAATLPSSPGITRTAVTAQVDAIEVTPRSVWIAAGGLVVRVNPVTRRTVVVPDIETVEPPVVRLVAGAGAVWAATTAGRQLLRIDPRTARVTASLPIPAQAVAADRSGVWTVCCEAGARGGRLTRIDPTSNRVVKVIALPSHPYALGVGPSGVWVRDAGGLVWRIDPTSNRVVATIRLPSITADPGGDIVVTNDSVWVSNPATATVRRIDSRRNQVTEGWEADGSDLTLAADGVVWATSDTRLLGLGGPDVRGPRRNLHELHTDRITAVAAARDGGLWLGTTHGLFHIDRAGLRDG